MSKFYKYSYSRYAPISNMTMFLLASLWTLQWSLKLMENELQLETRVLWIFWSIFCHTSSYYYHSASSAKHLWMCGDSCKEVRFIKKKKNDKDTFTYCSALLFPHVLLHGHLAWCTFSTHLNCNQFEMLLLVITYNSLAAYLNNVTNGWCFNLVWLVRTLYLWICGQE